MHLFQQHFQRRRCHLSKQHPIAGYPNVFKCSKVSRKIDKAICENLESFRTDKQCIVEKCEEFDWCGVGNASYDQNQGCGEEATKDIEMEITIRALRAQYVFVEDAQSAYMQFVERP